MGLKKIKMDILHFSNVVATYNSYNLKNTEEMQK